MIKKDLISLNGIKSIDSLEDGSIIIKFQDTNHQLKENKESEVPEFEKDKISQQNAAKLFSVSVQTIINWKKRGLINEYRIGKPVFYRKSELLIASKKHKFLQKI